MTRRHRVNIRVSPRTATLIITLSLLPTPTHTQEPTSKRHVADAERLVQQLDLSNTNYEHGVGSITWTGTVASHTDCSGFIDQLLMHDDGYTSEQFKRWFGIRRPTAATYHDAIASAHGFTRVLTVPELQLGDVIAIKYLTRHDNTGHIMLVVGKPKRVASTVPRVDGTTQWEIEIIDSSESGHGPTDTRHKRGADGKDHDGLGRGIFRVYTFDTGEIAGFTWSTIKSSKFVSPDAEHVLMGRFMPGFAP
jgi:hypothetical protein